VYLERFREVTLASPNVQVVDILPALHQYDLKERRAFFLPQDGHFTRRANQIIARTILEQAGEVLRANRGGPVSELKGTSRNRGADYLLGISCFYHDSAAALLRDGKMVAAAQEERFTRTKHDKRFPQNAIAYCLEEAGIDVGQIGAVCYYDNMSITLERMMQTQLRLGRQGRRLWMSSMPSWIGAKLNLPDILREQVGYEGQILQTLHHRSHAASAFYMSPFSEAAIVTCDGVGEFATAAIGYGKGNELKLLKEIHFPNSLGLLYAAFTAFTGFKVNSGEYKMMGLAPYGRPRYVERIRQHLIRENGDGSFVMNMDYFDYLGGRRMFGDKVNELLDGPPRKPESRITQREMDIAASIQHVTEDILLRMVKHAKELTGASYLTMAGGVALNCVATGRILREGPFDDIWIQPASGDAGGAMGACLDAYYGYFHGQRETTNGTSPQGGSYWGPEYSRDEIDAFLNTNGLKSHELSQEERADVIAGLLADGKVVGHFVGRMEFGPRALGARSIIADPRTVEMQSKLNLKIKYRESFRPFAPTVLEERVQDYFQMETPSPYMLLVANVKEHRCRTVDETLYPDLIKRLQQPRSDIPAVTHVDYSARIQTINRNDLPQYYDVVKAFERKTGTAVVVNTSFNVRGEPIVCTPEDAYRCFMRTEIDVLVLENRLLFKHEQPGWVEKADWREEFELD
jgi:carbamoyltransferase